jgi:uncharacterized YigZ family protein
MEGVAHAEQLWKQHPKATHVCYAYKLGLDDNAFRINDDGEPSGTAGKPIFGQIISKKLTDVGVYVVRYYGGTNLGASGLIAAYKETAQLALDQAVIVKKSLYQLHELTFEYDHMGQVLNDLKHLNVHIVEKQFFDFAKVIIAVQLSSDDLIIKKLKARMLDFSIDRISDETEIDFCTFVKKEVVKL